MVGKDGAEQFEEYEEEREPTAKWHRAEEERQTWRKKTEMTRKKIKKEQSCNKEEEEGKKEEGEGEEEVEVTDRARAQEEKRR